MKSVSLGAKRASTVFLQLALAVIALAVLAICIFALPAGLRTEEAQYYHPIFWLLYTAAVPFYVALFQSYKLLKLIDSARAFSVAAVVRLMNIKYCAVIVSLLFTLAMPLFYYAAETDDAPGVILMGLIIIFASAVIATFAGVLQRLLKSALDIKSENDLTV